MDDYTPYLKGLIEQLDEQRRGSRPDVARELSIAITHLEDAAYRLAIAGVRTRLNPADAAAAVGKLEHSLVGVVPDDVVEETTTQED